MTGSLEAAAGQRIEFGCTSQFFPRQGREALRNTSRVFRLISALRTLPSELHANSRHMYSVNNDPCVARASDPPRNWAALTPAEEQPKFQATNKHWARFRPCVLANVGDDFWNQLASRPLPRGDNWLVRCISLSSGTHHIHLADRHRQHRKVRRVFPVASTKLRPGATTRRGPRTAAPRRQRLFFFSFRSGGRPEPSPD